MNYELNKDFVNAHLNDDVNKLALSKFPEDIDKQFVIRQIQARQLLKKKLPSWSENDELLFPRRLSLEQCSSELTARYKSFLTTNPHESTRIEISVDSRKLVDETKTTNPHESPRKISADSCQLVDETKTTNPHESTRTDISADSCQLVDRTKTTNPHESTRKISADSRQLVDETKTLVDLTGGMGVDTSFLSDNFDETIYVESQEELCELTRHNFKVLGKNITVVNDKAEDFLERCPEVDCIYLDPARRDEYGRKMVSLHDCSPDAAELQDLLLKKAKTVMIKLSPMLDIDIIKKELKNIKEIHIVAVRNECKEVLVVLRQQTTDNGQQTSSKVCPQLITKDLREDWNFTFTEDEEHQAQWTLADSIGKYLYEPGVACMKAACFKLLSQRFNLNKLHRNSHLYTSDELVADFPGRIFEVIGVFPFDKKIKNNCSQLTAQSSKASIAVRNFPLIAEQLRKQLGFKDGDDLYIFGTTTKGDKKVVIVTMKINNV
ncbi:MAG: hypothetical protein IJZ06_00965 [Bacteroidales bacterium]|nr:hypothetical protein [Bacteroidales bacterium]